MLPGGWRLHVLSFPQRPYRKANKSPDFVQAKAAVPTHQEEAAGNFKAQGGGDRKAGHDRSNLG